MSDKFISLECDDDVILFEKDSFKVNRLRELVYSELMKKLNQSLYSEKHQGRGYNVNQLFGEELLIVQEHIKLNEIEFKLKSFKDCQILQIGAKGWKKGKLKILISISPINEKLNKIHLEFCPEEPETPESPLDDLRQSLNNT